MKCTHEGCEREVLPGLVMCEEHATPETVRWLVQDLFRRLRTQRDTLRAEIEELVHERDKAERRRAEVEIERDERRAEVERLREQVQKLEGDQSEMCNRRERIAMMIPVGSDIGEVEDDVEFYIHRLRSERDEARVQLHHLREAECPRCGRSLPPDGDCHGCRADRLESEIEHMLEACS